MSKVNKRIAACKRGRLTPEERAEIERLALSMKRPTSGKIAAKLDRHPATVNWYLLTKGLIERKPGHASRPYLRNGRTIYPYSDDQDRRAEELRASGKTYREIAAALTAEFGIERTGNSVQVRMIQLAAAP